MTLTVELLPAVTPTVTLTQPESNFSVSLSLVQIGPKGDVGDVNPLSIQAVTDAQAAATAATQKAADANASAVQAVQAKQDAETAKNAAVAVVTGGTASLNPAAGKIPIADADGRISAEWIRQQTNDIGVPGTLGFGVGIAPSIPSGYSVMTGTTILGHDNYGNYQYSDGSVMVWVPRCWFKYGLGVANNGITEGVWDVKPANAFKDEATANAAGYMSHRADWDGGLLMPGQMVDKYQVSNNGGIGSSIKNAMPVVSGPSTGQVGFNALNGAPTNAYHGAIVASKTRGAQFFPTSRFIYAKLAILSLAHAQASTNTTYAAWYGATTNFPKGNNNNNLKDVNDATVTYTTAGASSYPNFALTGSGVPFNKTTHNGQNCGIADLNGNLWEISLGMTCIAVSKTITAATQANPVQITAAAHGFATGDIVMITSVVGMTQINDKLYKITVNGTDTFTLDGCDGTAFTAYTSGGSVARGKWYAAKKSVAMKDFTSGTTLATDHWGATGVAAMMDQIYPEFRLDYPNNGFAQRFGNGSGLVFSNANTGNDWTLTGLGIPKTTGISTSGTNAYGQDYYYQYVRDQLCVLSGGYWVNGTNAGVWNSYLNYLRADSNYLVGFRSASYPVAP